MAKNYYDLLGVSPAATTLEIADAFRELAKSYDAGELRQFSHVYKGPHSEENLKWYSANPNRYSVIYPSAEDKASGITEPKVVTFFDDDEIMAVEQKHNQITLAYETLSDPAKRQKYDAFMSQEKAYLQQMEQLDDRLAELEGFYNDPAEANAYAEQNRQWREQFNKFRKDQEALMAAAEIQSDKGGERTADRSWRGDTDKRLIAFAEEYRDDKVTAISRLTSKTQGRSGITHEMTAVAAGILAGYAQQRNVSTPLRSEVGDALINTANKPDPREWISNPLAVMAHFNQNVAGRR
ncbi:MAG: hypothetical protein INF44_01700 [Thalassospira sp.]|jgi:curved DNA-binding protein CbpA|nr:hypothetical protein [Thalassospira sp.]